jgi:hypothetical protein
VIDTGTIQKGSSPVLSSASSAPCTWTKERRHAPPTRKRWKQQTESPLRVKVVNVVITFMLRISTGCRGVSSSGIFKCESPVSRDLGCGTQIPRRIAVSLEGTNCPVESVDCQIQIAGTLGTGLFLVRFSFPYQCVVRWLICCF